MEQLLAEITGFLRAVGPEVVFFVTLAETAFFIGLLVPAEATVLVAAFYVAEGVFSLEAVLLATMGGAFAGDQIGYALGRFGGRRFAARSGRVGRLWAKTEPRATKMFRGHPIVAVSLARFVSFVRTLMPWFAGMSHMRYPRFAFYDALGVVGWGGASVLAGYLAGESWHVLAGALGTASAIIVSILLITLALAVVRTRRAARGGKAAVDGTGPPMFRVALTGNIASGKSAIASEWERLGAEIVDADELARQAVEPGTPGLDRVRDAFGATVIEADGTLDRAALRRTVFSDPARRQALEQILHPEIARLRDDAESALRARGTEIVVHVIPLLFETGMEDEFDAVVLVDSPEPARLIRLIEARGLAAVEAASMIDAQQPVARKRRILAEPNADRLAIVIENDRTLTQLQERAQEAWREIEKAASRRR